ncbi:hypothetical protein [Actinopolymorpha alba]|uniref:hypothetical protein n=1 Tax=Actinopolymorpha alba TaxID=533267 RepID=UPI00039FF51F|nr:hypothetical protein [Actinopolymorpha alba]
MAVRLFPRSMLILAVVVSSLLGTLSAVASAGAAPTATTGITSVSAGDASVVVAGAVDTGGDPVAVYALGAEADPNSLTGMEPAGTTTAAADGSFRVSVPRLDQAGEIPG